MRTFEVILCVAVALCGTTVLQAKDAADGVTPARIKLTGPDSRWQLQVDGHAETGLSADLTRNATYQSRNADIASVSPNGLVRGESDGETVIDVAAAGRMFAVPVTVTGAQSDRTFHFENDIIPIFSRFGCNTSGCHGKAEGQNGFKLSIFGFAPEADHASLLQEGRGRRTVLPIPDQSLLLLKASGGVPHGGGLRIRRGSGEYRLLRNWIAAGAPFGEPDAPTVVDLRVTPSERRMQRNASQQLQVTAIYSDGHEADVTHHAKFQSNVEALARVDEYGLITTDENPGEAAVMASYMGAVGVFRAIIPQPDDGAAFPSQPVQNFIDELVDARLRKLNIRPSGLCNDSDYLRRVYLDIIGTLPTAGEARAFLSDQSPDKRSRLVDALLKRPEYADFHALKWADVLRVDRLALGHKPAFNYYQWIRDSFAANKPFDDFASEIVAASGPLNQNPGGNIYKVLKKPGEAASVVSQVFLGVRIECAQCHHHPFDRWSQHDYYGMEAFFTQVSFKPSPVGEAVVATKKTTTKHPRSGDVVQAHGLMESMPAETPSGDRRALFADWMTSADNQWFARNIVNRIWAHFLGRGLVEPVDDFRSTNPPTNPELLTALAENFVESGFDLHNLIRTITASRTYQLSAATNESNRRDEQNYSRALIRRLDAEVRLDMICQVTGTSEKFRGVPVGYRAIQLWDSQVPHYFLSLFGRPVRATACECERATSPSVAQVLHVLNSPEIQSKLSDDGGDLARLTESINDNNRLVEELYLTFYSRRPSEEERTSVSRYLSQSTDRRQAVEDVAWSFMNTVEFLFNH